MVEDAQSGMAGSPEVTIAAATVLRSAQEAMTSLLVGAGLGGARATDVARRLEVDKTLAWKVSRFVDDVDAVSAAKHMPGSSGIEIVLKAAAAIGVPVGRIEAVRDADRRLREFMAEHAGDRRTFEAMLAGQERDERVMLEERKAHYRSGSVIWGVRAKAQFLMLAFKPSEADPDRLDTVQIGGLIGLERLRSDVPWIVRRLRVSSDAGREMYRVPREPLDPSGTTLGGMPLIPEYCSDPLPEIRQTEAANGWIYDELMPGTIGRAGAVSLVTGEVYRGSVPRLRSEDNTYGRYMLTVRTPVEHVQMDLLLHRSMTNFSAPVAEVAGLLEDRPSGTAMGGVLLRGPEPAVRLGSPVALQTHRLDGYQRMVLGGLERAGWGGADEFVGYRVEVEYPGVPCELNLRCEIRAE